LLRRGQITSETLTFAEGEMEWRPFGDRSQFIVAKEMPKDATSQRQVDLEEAASAGKSLIPLPSQDQLIQLGMAVVLLAIGYAIIYEVARADAITGLVLFFVSSAVALVALLFIAFQMFDEDWLTLVLLALVPFYDIYYFATNSGKYLPLLSARYGGIVFAAAAYAGLASAASHQSSDIKSLLQTIGL
jgi:hypothetical protein